MSSRYGSKALLTSLNSLLPSEISYAFEHCTKEYVLKEGNPQCSYLYAFKNKRLGRGTGFSRFQSPNRDMRQPAHALGLRQLQHPELGTFPKVPI